MLLAEQGGAVVPIRLGEPEVVVVERVVCHRLLLVVYLPSKWYVATWIHSWWSLSPGVGEGTGDWCLGWSHWWFIWHWFLDLDLSYSTLVGSEYPLMSLQALYAQNSRICLLINAKVPSTPFQQTNDYTHIDTTFIYGNHSSRALLSIPSCHAS